MASEKLKNDDEWEDINSDDRVRRRTLKVPSSPSSTGSSRTRSSPRKLKHQKQQPRPVKVPPVITREEVMHGFLNGIAYSLKYLFDVLWSAISLLKRPLSLLLGIWLLLFICGVVMHRVRLTLRPLCFLPGFGAICRDPAAQLDPDGNSVARWANFPNLVDMQSKSFEQLLESSIGGSALALNLKKGSYFYPVEMATTDLITLTRISDLKSKDLLAESLSTFVNDARKTGRGLTRLSAKVGGTVDQILAVNDYALHSIEAAQASPGTFSVMLRPWKPSNTQEIVLQTFSDSMNVLSLSIQKLIIEAESELFNLDKLEQDLSAIHEVISREDRTLNIARSDLLSDLWTKLGGNRKTLRGYNDNLILLKALELYRKQALGQVMMALQALNTLSEDMEDLRERVANPALLEARIPVEVHMKSIRGGIQRLKESRVRAKDRDEEETNKILNLD